MSIKDFIFNKDIKEVRQHMLVQKALAHYCEKCDRGFKTKGATSAHKAIKHKNENK